MRLNVAISIAFILGLAGLASGASRDAGTEFYLDISTNFGTTDPTSGWFPEGETVVITWLAPPPEPDVRGVFAGWSGMGPGSYTGALNPATIVMNGPIIERADAVREFRFVFDTSPTGLILEIDGIFIIAPLSAWWVEGSVHSVTCATPQPGWVFLSWDDGVTDNPRIFTSMAPEQRTCLFAPAFFSGATPADGLHATGLGLVLNRSAEIPPSVTVPRIELGLPDVREHAPRLALTYRSRIFAI